MVRHCQKKFLLLHRAWDREYGLGDCWLDCCHSWLSRYLKQGSIPVPIKKMWKEHCFYNEYTCLLSFLVNGSSISFCTCDDVYRWDRLLIKCDLVINFTKQETNIPPTCIFIYKVKTKLVQCISTPLLQITLGKEKKKKEKKCVICFVHVCTSKKTF